VLATCQSSGVTDTRDRALDVLLADRLEPIVELVAWSPAPGTYEVRAADGRVRFGCDADGSFDVEEVEGRNPVGDQAVDRFAGVEAERASLHPARTANAYPHAYEMVAQVFDHACAPDLCVVHTAAHNWEDQGGHRGEHGSLDAVQARAPFVIAGAGVERLGTIDRACRLVDVAPTVLALLGGSLSRTDGAPMDDLVAEPGAPRHVIGFLWDGTNPNVLYDLAARGDAPNVARLMALGTTFRFGAMASLPTVTLANHTAILTGCHPGHHGILHNAWYDRAAGLQVITNSGETWANAGQHLAPGIDTIHSAVKRLRPGAYTASMNEPCDVFADYSTFDLVRRGVPMEKPPGPDALPHATERFVRPVKEYRWSSRTDHSSVTQFEDVWQERRPDFTWVNFTLTDAAFHEGGPHSEIAEASVHDTDARLGRVLDLVEASGAWDDTAFFLVADHGMEETNPTVRGDWGDDLRAAGIPFRDEAFGFLYLDVE
jgi:phosphonoacetate hydrolase